MNLPDCDTSEALSSGVKRRYGSRKTGVCRQPKLGNESGHILNGLQALPFDELPHVTNISSSKRPNCSPKGDTKRLRVVRSSQPHAAQKLSPFCNYSNVVGVGSSKSLTNSKGGPLSTDKPPNTTDNLKQISTALHGSSSLPFADITNVPRQPLLSNNVEYTRTSTAVPPIPAKSGKQSPVSRIGTDITVVPNRPSPNTNLRFSGPATDVLSKSGRPSLGRPIKRTVPCRRNILMERSLFAESETNLNVDDTINNAGLEFSRVTNISSPERRTCSPNGDAKRVRVVPSSQPHRQHNFSPFCNYAHLVGVGPSKSNTNYRGSSSSSDKIHKKNDNLKNLSTALNGHSSLPFSDFTNVPRRSPRSINIQLSRASTVLPPKVDGRALRRQNKRSVHSTPNMLIGRRLFDDNENRPSVDDNINYDSLECSRINDFESSDEDIGGEGYESPDEEINAPETEATNTKINGAESEDEDLGSSIHICPRGYASLGGPTAVCAKCGAIMWKEERVNKQVTKGTPRFSLCCRKGRVVLPPVRPIPSYLESLYADKIKGPSFRKCIRLYNSMFSFTSMGGKIDNGINRGGAPYVFKLNGQNHHKFGSLLPRDGDNPQFCQLYIYDTDNEVGNRTRWIDVKDSNKVDPEIVEGILKMLDDTNHLVKCFRMARDRFRDEQIVDLRIVLRASRSESGRVNHMTPSDEVAAIMVGDLDETCGKRDVVIESKIDGLKRISEIHPLFMAMQYPLLFPYGEDGFHEDIYFVKVPELPNIKREKVSQLEFSAYMLQVRRNGALTLRLGGRLYQQYVVDSFCAIEQSRLWYIRCNQKKLRNELYSHIVDYINQGDGDAANIGQSFILPSSFVGSRRYMQQNFQDALAVCRFIGHPDLFMTMTCNPMWDEVLKMMSLLPGCQASDCPDIIARVFKLKLTQITHDIKKKNYFGKCIGVMYVVEWQKRGLPHVHMLIWLDSAAKKTLNDNVNKFVTAEIPDPKIDPIGYEAVKSYMIHGPCGLDRPKSPCMRDFKCIRHFPKSYCPRTIFDQSGFPVYVRRKTGITVKVRKCELDNQWVVPYNRNLLVKYQCHINVEICNRARCLKYLFKYCLKGSDRATVEIRSKGSGTYSKKKVNSLDEISTFFDGRYVCGAEAAHRIFAFDIHHRTVSVERLPFHLEGDKNITYESDDDIEAVAEAAKDRLSKLEAFFILNSEDPEAHQYTYDEVPQNYVWNRDLQRWQPRLRGKHIGRLSYTHHSTGELWYLRMLLSRIRGATSYEDLRTVRGTTHSTFQDACRDLGLLESDKEWHECIKESNTFGLPPQIRLLFVHIMVNCKVSNLKELWATHWRCMADDILYNKRKDSGRPELQLSDIQLQYFALAEIHKLLKGIGKSLKDFKQLPQPPSRYLNSSTNNLVLEETLYDKEEMLREHLQLLSCCNAQQLEVFNAVLQSVIRRKGGFYFVYGSGGCGKTFLWKTIISRLRADGKIVLPVASSGIAATLMPGGRTAHSRFKIPILLDDLSTCSISQKSDIAELIKKTDLIIWDEAPMQHRYAFECLDRTLRDIMKSVCPSRSEQAFGGITVLLGGDFRQILPVISRGSRSDIVSSCITRSKLWRGVQLFVLSQNMRLTGGLTDNDRERVRIFGQWVLDIGNGKPCIGHTEDLLCENDVVNVPVEFNIPSNKDSIHQIIESTYPNLAHKYNDPSYLRERAILTPTNLIVSHLNSIILDKLPGDNRSYYSADKAEECGCRDSEVQHSFPVEYLNSITIPGIPPHELTLKVGAVVMLMRNLNQTLGLCNGTRMIVRRLLEHSIECEVIAGNSVGSRHFIPRMEMSPTETRFPFILTRRQFPLQLCYAMTINKSQGQSLNQVGLYLPKDVFTHGQFYVAVSRVTAADGLKILIDNSNGRPTCLTKNVVYEEVFYNLPHTS